MIDAFVETDESFREQKATAIREIQGKKTSGSTAVIAFVLSTCGDPGVTEAGECRVHHEIIVANVGDSRCVVYDDGKTVAMTRDHIPTDPDEYSRIVKAHGYVMRGRTMGHLAMSRAMGDYLDKSINAHAPIDQQPVVPLPDVSRTEVVSTEKLDPGRHDHASKIRFILLATDGLWDVLSNEDATRFIAKRLAGGSDLDSVGEKVGHFT